MNVCIAGRGPYPFVLDSGAGESIIDRRLATQLQLAHDGSPTEFGGVGCTGNAQPVSVPSWSVAGVALAPQVADGGDASRTSVGPDNRWGSWAPTC